MPPDEGGARAAWFASLDNAITMDVRRATVRLTASGHDEAAIDDRLDTYVEWLAGRVRAAVDLARIERWWSP